MQIPFTRCARPFQRPKAARDSLRAMATRRLAALCLTLVAIGYVKLAQPHTLVYWLDFALHANARAAGNGAAYHTLQPAASVTDDGGVQHAGRSVYLTYPEVSRRLAAYPAQAEAGLVTHPNMLAEIELSFLPWEGLSSMHGIALGSTPAAHGAWRPFLNQYVGRAAAPSRYTPSSLRASAEAYLADSSTLELPVDVRCSRQRLCPAPVAPVPLLARLGPPRRSRGLDRRGRRPVGPACTERALAVSSPRLHPLAAGLRVAGH